MVYAITIHKPAEDPFSPMVRFNLHLLSDSTAETLEIVANQESHRPIRDGVPGQRVLDVTGTWLEPYHGNIFGRFVRRGEGVGTGIGDRQPGDAAGARSRDNES